MKSKGFPSHLYMLTQVIIGESRKPIVLKLRPVIQVHVIVDDTQATTSYKHPAQMYKAIQTPSDTHKIYDFSLMI